MTLRRGYFAIGIERGKTAANIGTLWRSAHSFGAAFIFTIGPRYKRQASDMKAWRHLPLSEYVDLDDFCVHLPFSSHCIGIELDARAEPIAKFVHPERAVYLLGAEDSGLSAPARQRCDQIIQLPGRFCLNVAVAGSIVMFDRWQKRESA